MCGITAIFAYRDTAPAVDRDEIEAITAQMIPRGPDAGGTWFSADGRVGLGSRRLAIIDLHPEGNQPMHDASGDLSIVFNGEIYNYRDLRAQLEKKGAAFRSHSDTEVLIEMYRLHGERMVELLRGMFAFVIFDARRRQLFIARDPYGIKPLYYSDDGATIRIASTVKALMAGGAIPRAIDPAGATGFFLLGSVPEPFTIRAAIASMEPGTTLTIHEDGTREQRHWYSIAAVYEAAGERLAVAELTMPQISIREQICESIAAHLEADVPIGIFLSAGIDSATLAELAIEVGIKPLHAVTILFDVFRGKAQDESGDAAAFAASRGIQHMSRVVTRDEFLGDLPKIFEAMDQPSIDGVNSWFVSKAAAGLGLKVALSGVGGDELFGSYPSFREAPRITRLTQTAERLPLGRAILDTALKAYGATGRGGPKLRELTTHGSSIGGAYFLKRGLYMPPELETVLPRDLAEEGLTQLALDERFMAVLQPYPANEFGAVATLESSFYLRNQLLRDTDWASMAHSLEVRTPLVDAWLLRQLAPVLLRHRERSKDYFAASPLRPLPKAIASRPKTGFVTPFAEWLDLPPDGTPTRARNWARRVFEEYA